MVVFIMCKLVQKQGLVFYVLLASRSHHTLLQINYEPSALIGQGSISISSKALEEELQVIHETGEAVASSTGLCFLRDGIKWNTSKTWKEGEKLWRARYG